MADETEMYSVRDTLLLRPGGTESVLIPESESVGFDSFGRSRNRSRYIKFVYSAFEPKVGQSTFIKGRFCPVMENNIS